RSDPAPARGRPFPRFTSPRYAHRLPRRTQGSFIAEPPRRTTVATRLKDTAGFAIAPLHPVIGAEIRGIDLSRPLDAKTVEAVRSAWHETTVLLFRGQAISGADQLRFAEHFGRIAERHKPKPGANATESPEWTKLMPVSDKRDEDGNAIGALGHGEMWFHSDK